MSSSNMTQGERLIAWRCMNCRLATDQMIAISKDIEGIPEWADRADKVLQLRKQCPHFDLMDRMQTKRVPVTPGFNFRPDGETMKPVYPATKFAPHEMEKYTGGDRNSSNGNPYESSPHLEDEGESEILYMVNNSCMHWTGFSRTLKFWINAFKAYFFRVPVDESKTVWEFKGFLDGREERMMTCLTKLGWPHRTKKPINISMSKYIGDAVWDQLYPEPVDFSKQMRAILAVSIAKRVAAHTGKDRLLSILSFSKFGSVGNSVLYFLKRDFGIEAKSAFDVAEEYLKNAEALEEKREAAMLQSHFEPVG